MTKEQIRAIKAMQRRAQLDDPAYRLVLANVAGVTTCKDLDNAGFEDVMAVMEDWAAQREGDSGSYWRDKVARRGSRGTERMIWKIRELHGQYEELRGLDDTHYELGGLAARVSKQRTSDLAQLTPRECWNLIEALKDIIERLSGADAPVGRPSNSLEPAPF